MTLRNWNRDPFEGTYNPITITDYPMTVSLDPDLGKYGLRLPFAPLRTQSSGNMTIKRASDNFELTEVSRTTAPSTNEYRVDYEADTYLGTGWTQFNAANNGLEVLVSCKISGDLIKGGSIPELDADNTFTGDNVYIGNNSYRGSLTVPSGGTITYDGKAVAGYLDDGTPYYMKRFTGNWPASTTLSIAHGISGSPAANLKIINARVSLYESSTTSITFNFNTSSAYEPNTVYVTNTNLIAEVGASSTGTPYQAIIWYID